MRKARFLCPWKDSVVKPSIYHTLGRVVDRQFVLGNLEREQFRRFMRMQESFSGCHVLGYVVMSNHFHLLLEVPPLPAGGISDRELLRRLGAVKSRGYVREVARALAEARAEGELARVAEIHARFTCRMHNLSEFMKTLVQRFSRWFNRTHERHGTLWEERFKSVIVESGMAARKVAAYIDLNPVRAGMVKDPGDYRWSSYGEAVGGGPRGGGRKARAGLVRACMSHHGVGLEPEKWREVARIYRRAMGLALGRKSGRAEVDKSLVKEGQSEAEAFAGGGRENGTVLPEHGIGNQLLRRIRYFTDGAVIGSRHFVDEVFAASRERFPEKRKDGARPMRGQDASLKLWSMRDLRT
jgi:REP element-mobilizing transposase RayT